MKQNTPPRNENAQAWSPCEIRAELMRKGLNGTDVAGENATPQAVNLTINGRRKSLRMRCLIAKAVGVPVTEIWPDARPTKQSAPPCDKKRRGWSPNWIRGELIKKGLDGAAIAAREGVTTQAISLVILGKRRSFRLRSAIAAALGIEVTKIWPDAKPRKSAA